MSNLGVSDYVPDCGTQTWEGRARMAAARRAAGAELDDVDREALRRYPEPQMLDEAV